MDVKEIRKINLRALMKAFGKTQVKFAEEVGSESAYISQIFSAKTKADVGHALARRIEVKLGKPRGWMDTLDHAGQKDFEADQLLKDFAALPAGLREHVARKASELRKFSDALPGYLKNSLKPPEDPRTYREWERELEADMYTKLHSGTEQTN